MKKRRWQADPLSLQKVMNKTQLFTPEEQIKLTVPMKLAYEKLRTGAASEPDFHLLAACVNITMILSEKIGDEAVACAISARDAMMRCWDRFQKTGKLGFDSQALQDIPVAIDLHDQLMAFSTPIQVNKAVQEISRRMELCN